MDVGYFDGATEPRNPGGAIGYGWVLDMEGGEHDEGKAFAPPAPSNTNNIAEYSALNALLQAYVDAGGQGPLAVYGDSMLVVRQVNLDWACRGVHLKSLMNRAHRLIHQVPGGVILRHVPREKNAAADALSVAVLAEHGIKRTVR